MDLRTLLLTENQCYIEGKTMTPKGIMVHSTGANNPNLKRYVGPDDGALGVNQYGNHWNTYQPDGRQVCVHGFIGKLASGDIATYQTLPWNYVGWHSGSANANNNGYIGFEICEDDLTDKTYFDKVYVEAVELCTYLCTKYNLNPLTDIICHSEGSSLGIASAHGDVMHWFPTYGKSMDTFREDVNTAMGNSSGSTGTSVSDSTSTEYQVRVATTMLNIRKGPGTNYGTNGSIQNSGIYTIVDEDTGKGATKWGKLKSGAGWISLDFCNKA